MNALLTQLHDSLTRQFDESVAAQTLPVAEAWLRGSTALQRSALGDISEALKAGALVEIGQFVYLDRGFQQESRLASDLIARCAPITPHPEQETRLDAIAAGQSYQLNNEQRQAIDLGLRAHFGLLLGGPGTGKSTVIRCLVQAYLSAIRPDAQIALTAPTGKAAARLNGLVDGVVPTTLARLEQQLRKNQFFDLVVVDEASMIDLASAQRLLSLLPIHTRLVWVGDPNQLDSVEPGSILAELSQAPRLAPVTARLTQTYRFDTQTPLGALAMATLHGERERLSHEFSALGQTCQDLLAHSLTVHQASAASGLARQQTMLSEYQLLTATRVGPWGSQACNQYLSEQLIKQGLISETPGDGWLIMVTRNQPALGLSNGDVGVVQGQEFVLGNQRVPLHLIQAWEMAWAISVHKSQGSEYSKVGLMLGDTPHNQALSRALIYTGITRAKSSVRIGGTFEVLSAAVSRNPQRASGLADLIERA